MATSISHLLYEPLKKLFDLNFSGPKWLCVAQRRRKANAHGFDLWGILKHRPSTDEAVVLLRRVDAAFFTAADSLWLAEPQHKNI